MFILIIKENLNKFFVLDIEQPVRIYELARRMVKLTGLTVKDQHHTEGV